MEMSNVSIRIAPIEVYVITLHVPFNFTFIPSISVQS